MKKQNKKRTCYGIGLSMLLWLSGANAIKAQTNFYLNNAIWIAQENSFDAKFAQFSYMASYWTYRSF